LAACIICNWLGEGRSKSCVDDVVERFGTFGGRTYRIGLMLEI
jgi:hypothetical protein